MSDQPMCGHTKIKPVSWNDNGGTITKFMCIDCNTDFVQLTPELRKLMREAQGSSIFETHLVDRSGLINKNATTSIKCHECCNEIITPSDHLPICTYYGSYRIRES